MLISYFHIFQRGFQVLNAIFQACVCVSPLLLSLCITICVTVRKIFDILLGVELLIYSKKHFLIQQNNNYSSVYKSRMITRLIGFNIPLQQCSFIASIELNLLNSIKSLPYPKYIVYIIKWIPIMMPGDRVMLFCLFSRLQKFYLILMNFFFQIDCSFEIDFISRKFIFTHSKQIGEYLSKEV